MRLSKLL